MSLARRGQQESARPQGPERRNRSGARQASGPIHRQCPSPGRAFADSGRRACHWHRGGWQSGIFAWPPLFARPTCRSDRPGSSRRGRAPSESRRCGPAWAPWVGASGWTDVSSWSSYGCLISMCRRTRTTSRLANRARPRRQMRRACLRAPEMKRVRANARMSSWLNGRPFPEFCRPALNADMSIIDNCGRDSSGAARMAAYEATVEARAVSAGGWAGSRRGARRPLSRSIHFGGCWPAHRAVAEGPWSCCRPRRAPASAMSCVGPRHPAASPR